MEKVKGSDKYITNCHDLTEMLTGFKLMWDAHFGRKISEEHEMERKSEKRNAFTRHRFLRDRKSGSSKLRYKKGVRPIRDRGSSGGRGKNNRIQNNTSWTLRPCLDQRKQNKVTKKESRTPYPYRRMYLFLRRCDDFMNLSCKANFGYLNVERDTADHEKTALISCYGLYRSMHALCITQRLGIFQHTLKFAQSAVERKRGLVCLDDTIVLSGSQTAHITHL